jgi:hypothetical protein
VQGAGADLHNKGVRPVVFAVQQQARHDDRVRGRLAQAAGPPFGAGQGRGVQDEGLRLFGDKDSERISELAIQRGTSCHVKDAVQRRPHTFHFYFLKKRITNRHEKSFSSFPRFI